MEVFVHACCSDLALFKHGSQSRCRMPATGDGTLPPPTRHLRSCGANGGGGQRRRAAGWERSSATGDGTLPPPTRGTCAAVEPTAEAVRCPPPLPSADRNCWSAATSRSLRSSGSACPYATRSESLCMSVSANFIVNTIDFGCFQLILVEAIENMLLLSSLVGVPCVCLCV